MGGEGSEAAPGMRELYGFIAEYDRDDVIEGDLTYVLSAHQELIELSVETKRLTTVEMMISGYDDDPRSLYEVVEVRAWFQCIQQQWPDWLFWQTPGSLWVNVLSLNPGMFERLGDDRLKVQIDAEELFPQMAAAHAAASKVLRDAGLATEIIEDIQEEARTNIIEMMNQKRLGDYVVVHPTKGGIVTYRKQD